jgi:hypothetical protein
MKRRSQIWLMRALVVSGFMFSGALVYAAAHWLVWTDSAYQRVLWSPLRPVAIYAGIIVQYYGLRWLLTAGCFLGVCIIAAHAWRWLLLPIALLLLALCIFFFLGIL